MPKAKTGTGADADESADLILAMPTASRRRRKRYSDFETYRRLLKYLRGAEWLIVLLFLFMILEAVCTVGTISMVKPMVDLLIRGRLVDLGISETAIVPFELGLPYRTADGVAGHAGTGEFTGPQSARALEDIVPGMITPDNRRVVLDFSRVTKIDERGWASLEWVRLMAESTSVTTVLVLPAAIAPPEGLLRESTMFTTATTATLSAEASVIAAAIPPPAPHKERDLGLIARIKKTVIAKAKPLIERLEKESQGNMFGVLSVLVGIMLVFAAGVTIFGFLVGYISAYLGSFAVLGLRDHVYHHMLGLDMHYFNKQSIGALMSVVAQDVGSVSNAIDVLFSGVIKTPITVAVLLVAMIVLSPKLTLFCLTIVPAMAIVVVVIGRRVRRLSVKVQEKRAETSSIMNETFSGMRVVKACNMEEHESEKFRGNSATLFRTTIKGKIAEEIGNGLTSLFGFGTIGAVILAGGYTILQSGELSGSDFALFIGLLSQVFRPLKSVNKTNARIQRGLAGCDRVFAVLESRPKIINKPNAVTLGPLQREIRFEDVSFAYDRTGGNILKNIDLTVPRTKVIAFVGETGAGKSTLVNLIPRFYDPTQGRITWDGVDLREADVQSLRDQMAIITQDVILFDETIAYNIAYGIKEPISQQQIEGAAIAANAHKFITEKLPQGYSTRVGSRGVRLSGGERQRIAIARAILRDSPVLILDEATSALDSETESLIQDALMRVIAGRTVFVIAHRLSTVHNADEIIVMHNGQFTERGTHEELMELGGRYARYYNIQFKKKQSRPERIEEVEEEKEEEEEFLEEEEMPD